MGLYSVLLVLIFYLVKSSSCEIDWSYHKPKVCVDDDNYFRRSHDKIDMFVFVILQDLYEINEQEMKLGLNVFLMELWKDPSLKLDLANIKKPENVPKHVRDCIWTPDTIFPNIKAGRLYDVTLPNQFMKVIPKGYIYRISRYRLSINCPMMFKDYPMDSQECSLIIKLMSNTVEEVNLNWLNSSNCPSDLNTTRNFQIIANFRPLQFIAMKPTRYILNETYPSGTYTVLQVTFTFCRRLTASLVNVYIPSLLVVCLSWLSFWLDVEAVPGRVTLGVMALLTLATQMVNVRSSLPGLNYMTAMDIWLFYCLLMVFASLIEFTVAYSWGRKSKKAAALSDVSQTSRRTKIQVETAIPERDALAEILEFLREERSQRKPLSCQNPFDRKAKVVFPFAMLLFVSFYCSYYLIGERCKDSQ